MYFYLVFTVMVLTVKIKKPLNEHFNIHVSSPRIMQTTETNMT